MRGIYTFFLLLLIASCESSTARESFSNQHTVTFQGTSVVTRFQPPRGFTIQGNDSTSFAFFLQQLPLKAADEEVTFYNGAKKPKRNIYQAVVDLPIGKRDLHQCADAVIRLRADYLKSVDREDDIAFHFTNGFLCDYKTWKSGKRPSVNGNQVTWVNGNPNRDNYWKYLEMVFSYAGTLSLTKELQPKDIGHLKIGDVFIQGGSPGHAVIVVNLAKNEQGEKRFMLAQSYMPAQEIQILTNPKNQTVWFSIPNASELHTPEWTFELKDLKEF